MGRMGTFGLNSIPHHTMKVLLLTSALMVLVAADTCSDCTAVVNAVQARLMTEESIAYQQGILVSGLCPEAENVAECEEALPGFWAQIASLLWPEYWDPSAQWMCAPICAAPEDTVMTCDDCQAGVLAAIDQLLAPETLDRIVEILANGDFCAATGDERCPAAVDVVIRQGLPILTEASAQAGFAEACNAAVPGTCSARLF